MIVDGGSAIMQLLGGDMVELVKVPYMHGPLDGESEMANNRPREGEKRQRLVGNRYVEYRFRGSRGGFVAVEPGFTTCKRCGDDITIGYSNSGMCVVCWGTTVDPAERA